MQESEDILRTAQNEFSDIPIMKESSGPDYKMTVENLDFWYGDNKVLHDISLNVAKNKVTALIGPSGCGKSTFLRTLNRMNETIPGTKMTGTVTVSYTHLTLPTN